MPVPTSRYDQSPSPPSTMNTPSRSTTYLRQNSNASYYSPTVTGNGQQKLNVVTRVAIEGKAKKGEDGASIRMYLKMAIPIDSVSTGSTVALFSEQNVKIQSSQVHPLDNNSVPYNFSSAVSPLLKNAARSLKLPARSPDTFSSAFNLSRTDASTSSNRSHEYQLDDLIPPVDVQYTGQIIVSGYNISYVLPKVFLTRKRDSVTSLEEDNSLARTPARRRLSIGERNHAQFMAAIDMWVPFASRPPRSPYMLSIPTPRCLHNHIKLRIFPPNNAATSFASLSSIEDDNTVWDLTSDPQVTRATSSRTHRKSQSQHFADDESSDSSNINMLEGCEIQGTFPSAECVRVRWAKPLKNLNIPGDDNGRRRVGVEQVKAEMICTVRGKGAGSSNPDIEGILMDIEYQAQCKGVWFPGVATLLALDVGLEAKGSDITWPAGYSTQWEVSGGAGYTGFDNGIETNHVGLASRSSSTDSALPTVDMSGNIPVSGSRANSSSSLLRAPLPAQNMPDYSFEGQGASPSSSGTLPSVSSLPASSTPILDPPARLRHPGSPVSLHLNMNELQPSSNNSFVFKICGTILVTARTNLARVNGLNSSSSSNGDKRVDPEPIVLPRFTVLAADVETTTISIRNAVDSAVIEVYHPTGDIHSDPQTRKTVLQKGGFTRCGEDGGRMALKFLDAFNMTVNGVHGQARPPSRPRTSSNGMIQRSSSNTTPRSISVRHRRDGPAIIPSVAVTVTALASDANMFPTGYAVRVCLQTPTSSSNEFVEFGVAHSSNEAPLMFKQSRPQRKVHIICATIDGVAVKSEVTKASKAQAGKNASGFPLEDLAATEWICWAKVFCGNTPGCSMIIDYLVQHLDHKHPGERGTGVDALDIDLLLPIFFVSIARYEVTIDVMPSLEIAGLRSNFDYHHAYPSGNRLLRYSLEEYSQSQLVLTMKKPKIKSAFFLGFWKLLMIVTWIALLASLFRRNPRVWFRPTEALGSAFSDMDVMVDAAEFMAMPAPKTFESITVAHASHPTITSTMSQSATLDLGTVMEHETSTYSGSLPTTATLSPPSDEPMTNYRGHATIEETSTVTEPPQSDSVADYGLIPVDKLFIFDWSAAHTAGLKRTLDKVVGAIEALWNVYRTVYHYPLPPP